MNIMEHVTEQYPTLFKFKEWVYQRDYNKSIFFKYKYYDAYGNIKKAQQVFVKVISTSLEEHLQELEDEVSRQIKEMCGDLWSIVPMKLIFSIGKDHNGVWGERTFAQEGYFHTYITVACYDRRIRNF